MYVELLYIKSEFIYKAQYKLTLLAFISWVKIMLRIVIFTKYNISVV